MKELELLAGVVRSASVAVIVCVPAFSRVAEKLAVPAMSVEFAGSIAWASVLEKCTVPE